MKKLLKPREWIGTGIQLMIFALLLPYLCILLGIMVEAAPDAMDNFSSAVLSLFPFADPIQNVIVGMDIAQPGINILTYLAALFEVLEGNMVTAMYLGMWLYAFRLIFKELLGDTLRLYGLPILQILCGLFFGALTYTMLNELITQVLATVFLIVLNFVLTIICYKAPWKKILELTINLAMQSFLSALTIGYVAVIMSCLQGLFVSVAQAVITSIIVIIAWLVYLVFQYIVLEK